MEPEHGEKPFPDHVAIIMDGNGRWAEGRGLPRYYGHKNGAEAVRRITKVAAEKGIKYLTLFGFSSENWTRPEREVHDLMKLLRFYLRSETAELQKNNVKLKVIGSRERFQPDIVELIQNAETLTQNNDGITVIMALDYGGRDDILQSIQKVMADNKECLSKEELALQIQNNLMTASIPEPDLLIRTSGEFRISNFLLWQCAYTELYFTDTLWPDFNARDLQHALDDYAQRDRRYGGLSKQQQR